MEASFFVLTLLIFNGHRIRNFATEERTNPFSSASLGRASGGCHHHEAHEVLRADLVLPPQSQMRKLRLARRGTSQAGPCSQKATQVGLQPCLPASKLHTSSTHRLWKPPGPPKGSPKAGTPIPRGSSPLLSLHQAASLWVAEEKVSPKEMTFSDCYEQNNVPVAGSGSRPCAESCLLRTSWCGSWSICWRPPLPGTLDSGTRVGQEPVGTALCSSLQGLPQPLILLPVKFLLNICIVRGADARVGCHKGLRESPPILGLSPLTPQRPCLPGSTF